MTPNEVQEILLTKAAEFTHSPSEFIKFAYPWGRKGTDLEHYAGEREWQKQISSEIENHFSDPEKRFKPLKIAVASGHGIGKSAYLGMIGDWARSTFPNTRGRITANTEGQLKATTVPEIKKWHNLSIFKNWFNFQATSIKSINDKSADSWRIDMIPWSESNPAAFAGLHNARKRIIIIFDEASNIADIIWDTIEGAQTDADTEIIWLAFGNPLNNIGRFRECWRKYSKEWITFNIDSRDVEGTNVEQFESWRLSRGEDSDFFRTRVRGQFPNQSALQYYPTDLVEAAQNKYLRPEQFNFAPVIISCDAAWEGDDDLVIGYRQGLKFEILEVLAKNDNDMLIAQKIARYEDELNADAVFVDGGFGTGIISGGRTMGRNWTIVWFGGKSDRPDCKNKRAEMLANVLDWLNEGGSF